MSNNQPKAAPAATAPAPAPAAPAPTGPERAASTGNVKVTRAEQVAMARETIDAIRKDLRSESTAARAKSHAERLATITQPLDATALAALFDDEIEREAKDAGATVAKDGPPIPPALLQVATIAVDKYHALALAMQKARNDAKGKGSLWSGKAFTSCPLSGQSFTTIDPVTRKLSADALDARNLWQRALVAALHAKGIAALYNVNRISVSAPEHAGGLKLTRAKGTALTVD